MQGAQTLPLFADTTDDELHWLLDHSHEQQLAPGDYFFREGDPARHFYVVLEGELQITRTVNGETLVLGTTPRGIMGGETFLLSGTEVQSSAQAIVPTRLMVFDLPAFLGIFTHCPSVGIRILRTAAERIQGFAALMQQQEKMAALGKLAAGLAHELNNPAAAVTRSADTLRTLLPAVQAHTVKLPQMGVDAAALVRLVGWIDTVQRRAAAAPPLSTLNLSAREEEIGEWLEEFEVNNGWEMAAAFATAQLTVAELAEAVAGLPTAAAGDVLLWLCELLTALGLLGEIDQSTQRISELVGAIKSYTYMDRGVVQEVDLHRDLENTLLMLKHRLRGLAVVREYDPDLPQIEGRGGALNQVWTNLIDNAADALQGKGVIRLITRCENDFVMVEIADNGPGIPPEHLPRIFEPFFTTKAVGAGTGLGLDIAYRIVQQHNGTIEVHSKPGQTRFIVRLPVKGENQS